MTDLIDKLAALVESDQLLGRIDLESIDDILDQRESDPFDSKWMDLFKQVKPDEEAPAIASLRESAFKRTLSITGHPELAGFVSDDFGLLAQSLVARCDDRWLTSLFMVYAEGQIPGGDDHPEAELPLSELLLTFEV